MNMLTHLSTSTPASEISSAGFDDGTQPNETLTIDDIMKNSPVAELLGLKKDALPEDGEAEEVQDKPAEDSTDEDADESQKDDDEGAKGVDEEKEEVGDEDSTPESELPNEDEIDWTYKIPMTIDGQLQYKTLEEVRKGYATDQHLTSKGRQLAERQKADDAERQTKLDELVRLGTVFHEDMTSEENRLTSEYQKLTAKIDTAKENDDSYAAREAKEERDSVQEKYWKIRNSREERTKAVVGKIQEHQVKAQQELLKTYGEQIQILIPDYSDKVAKSVREFALKEGIPAVMLESIYDAKVVKFINDYRKLKTAKDTGEVKRKAVATVKSVPSKKGTPTSQRQAASNQATRSKVLAGQGSKQDENDFLKSISSISRKL
jgi:hypothetical protein